MGSIRELLLKVKSVAEMMIQEWGVIIIIFLAAFSSFGLGRLSATESARPPVTVAEAPEEAKPQGMAVGGLVIASRTGSVYHFPWCAGASQIKTENQIWFSSEEGAKDAGYAPSKNCKGLTAQ